MSAPSTIAIFVVRGLGFATVGPSAAEARLSVRPATNRLSVLSLTAHVAFLYYAAAWGILRWMF